MSIILSNYYPDIKIKCSKYTLKKIVHFTIIFLELGHSGLEILQKIRFFKSSRISFLWQQFSIGWSESCFSRSILHYLDISGLQDSLTSPSFVFDSSVFSVIWLLIALDDNWVVPLHVGRPRLIWNEHPDPTSKISLHFLRHYYQLYKRKLQMAISCKRNNRQF